MVPGLPISFFHQLSWNPVVIQVVFLGVILFGCFIYVFYSYVNFSESLFVTPVDFKGSATIGKAHAKNGDLNIWIFSSVELVQC